MKPSILFLAFIIIFSFSCKIKNEEGKKNSYSWKNVQIVGGGFVDGIVFHPQEKNLRYARTDMGGAYRWDENQQKWIPLMDWVSYNDRNLMGVESIALDPNNPNKLYLACGTYTADDAPNGEILISSDRGNSFTRIKMPFKMGGNEVGRGNGERMAVDPLNGNIIYLGTRHNGLWQSYDSGLTWRQVASFPVIHEQMPDTISEREKAIWNWALKGSGVVWVVFDSSKTINNNCKTIYAAYSLMNQKNLFRSNDGGKTWEDVPGQPTQYRPTHGILASNGILYITYGDIPGPYFMNNGAVWKYNTITDEWTEITPDKPEPKSNKQFGYGAIAVDPANHDIIITSVFHRSHQFGGDDIYRSIDGGISWKAVFANGADFDYSIAPYVQHTPIHWMFDLEIDPFNPNHAVFTTGFGGFETYNLKNVDKGEKTKWQVYTNGIEETVPLTLCSPPKGAELISGIGDYAGFVHWDLNQSTAEQYFTNPYFGNCDWLACAELNPAIIVRVGIASGHHPGSNIGYSTDYGKTWKPAKMPNADSRHGTLCVSAKGSIWIWTPEHQHPYYSGNSGKTWSIIEDLPVNTQVIADRVHNDKFYAIDIFNNSIYTSTDGAKTFNAKALNLEKGITPVETNRGDIRGGQDRIYATPAFENDLWIAAFDGLYHARKTDSTFLLMPYVSEIHAFGFGKAAPGKKYPAIYLIGVVDHIHGIYRSNNMAKSWVRINDDEHQWGLILQITGDPKKYGRVYLGTHGRGIIYGDIID